MDLPGDVDGGSRKRVVELGSFEIHPSKRSLVPHPATSETLRKGQFVPSYYEQSTISLGYASHRLGFGGRVS